MFSAEISIYEKKMYLINVFREFTGTMVNYVFLYDIYRSFMKKEIESYHLTVPQNFNLKLYF